MHDPNDRRFCPHCGFELGAHGGCRACDPDSETVEDAFLHLRARRRQCSEPDFDLDAADDTSSERDLGGCLPVTPPLGLVAGTMRNERK